MIPDTKLTGKIDEEDIHIAEVHILHLHKSSELHLFALKPHFLCLLTNLTLPSQDSDQRGQNESDGQGDDIVNAKRGGSACENDDVTDQNGRSNDHTLTRPTQMTVHRLAKLKA